MKDWLVKNLDIESVLSKGLIVEWENLYDSYLVSGNELVSPTEFRSQIDDIVSELVGISNYIVVTDQYIFSVPAMIFELYKFCDEYWKNYGSVFALSDVADSINNENPVLQYNIGRTFKNEIANYFIRCRRCKVEKNVQGKKFIYPTLHTKRIKKISFIKNKIKYAN
jgi:hypothetical protein